MKSHLVILSFNFFVLTLALSSHVQAAGPVKREEMVISEIPVASSPFSGMEAFSAKVQKLSAASDESVELDIPQPRRDATSSKSSSFSDRFGNPMSASKETPLRSFAVPPKKTKTVTVKSRSAQNSVMKKSKKNKKIVTKLKKKNKSAQKRANAHSVASTHL